MLDSALPAVDGRPSGELPEGLYRFVMAVSWRQQLSLCLLTFLVFPLTLAPLELQRRIVNDAIGEGNFELLLWLGGVYLAIVLLQGVLKYLRNVYLERVGQGLSRRLRRRIVDNESFGGEIEEGTKQSMIAAEAETVGGFAAESLAFPLLQLGIVFSIAGYMLVVDPLVAAVALGFFVPSILLMVILQPRLNRLTGQKTQAQRALGEAVLEGDREAADATAVDRTPIDRLIDQMYGLKIKIALFKYALKLVNNLLGHLGPLSVLVVGGWMVIEGQTTLGTVVAFLSGYDKMSEPARELLNFYRRLSMMKVQYRMVREAAGGGPVSRRP